MSTELVSLYALDIITYIIIIIIATLFSYLIISTLAVYYAIAHIVNLSNTINRSIWKYNVLCWSNEIWDWHGFLMTEIFLIKMALEINYNQIQMCSINYFWTATTWLYPCRIHWPNWCKLLKRMFFVIWITKQIDSNRRYILIVNYAWFTLLR